MKKLSRERRDLLIYIGAILIVSLATYISNYYNPPAVFWDENYHIASAQKYLDGVMYMEPHPPLGKLFIALGEWILHPNDALDLTHFTQTDYIKKFPEGYSFAGVRLFPSLFGALGGVLFFLILYKISRAVEVSFLFSALYIFENGMILQSRSAMLESAQIFFIFATLLYFLYLLDREKIGYKEYFGFGLLMGITFMIKVNGLIMVLLFVALFLYRLRLSSGYLKLAVRFVLDAAVVAFGMAAVVLVVFYIHFSLGKELSVKTYSASDEYIQIIENDHTSDISNFPIMLRDNFKYMRDYAKGVPSFNPCKAGENGSLVTTWPFINKTINYRWSKNDEGVRYLYLMGNPIVWFGVIFAMILAISLIVSRYVFALKSTDERLFFIITTLSAIYISYFITLFNIERVMYLYHYFIPLFMGAFILFTLFVYIFKEQIEQRSKVLLVAVILMVLLIIYTYWFFSPFTYYQPLDTVEFMRRSWFEFWKLEPIL